MATSPQKGNSDPVVPQRAPYPPDILAKAYSRLVRHRFGSWGLGSYVQPPCTAHHPKWISIGRNVFVREHCWLNASQGRADGRPTLVIGDGTYIGRFAHINAYQDLVIESDVLIADRVYISDVDHKYTDPQVPIIHQGYVSKGPVLLGSGCWIGVGAVILPGVRIGKNAVVGANAVVTHDVPEHTIVAGIPARILKVIT